MRLDHIGIAVAELDETDELMARLLGRTAYKRETIATQRVATSFFAAAAADAKLEFVAPTEPDSPITRFLEKRGPGLHHLAFSVDDIRAEMARLTAAGFTLLQQAPVLGADNKLVCFLHPKTTGGILVELCQEQPAQEAPGD